MIVQGDRHLNLKVVDYDLARAIRKAPSKIGLRLKQNPCASDLLRGREMNRCNLVVEKRPASFKGRFRATSNVRVSSMQ